VANEPPTNTKRDEDQPKIVPPGLAPGGVVQPGSNSPKL
jgi:hypothetical protein